MARFLEEYDDDTRDWMAAESRIVDEPEFHRALLRLTKDGLVYSGAAMSFMPARLCKEFGFKPRSGAPFYLEQWR
jgi:hypothetical protein